MSHLLIASLHWVRETKDDKAFQVFEELLETIILIVNLINGYFALQMIAGHSSLALSSMVLDFCGKLLQVALSLTFRFYVRSEAVKSINQLLEKCPASLRETVLRNTSEDMALIHRLARFIPDAGDYELQVGMTETLFRLTNRESRNKLARAWFTDELYLDAFCRVRDSYFETDCRTFLNTVNCMNPRQQSVASFPCAHVFIGDYELHKPEDECYSEFWIDFNRESKRISLFCSQDYAESQQTDDGGFWETVAIKEDDVEACDVAEIPDSFIELHIKIYGNARDLIGFGPTFHDQNVKVLFTANGRNLKMQHVIKAVQLAYPNKVAEALKKKKMSSPKVHVQVNYTGSRKAEENRGFARNDDKSEIQDSQGSVANKKRHKVSVPMVPMSSPAIYRITTGETERAVTPQSKLVDSADTPTRQGKKQKGKEGPNKTPKRVKTPLQMLVPDAASSDSEYSYKTNRVMKMSTAETKISNQRHEETLREESSRINKDLCTKPQNDDFVIPSSDAEERNNYAPGPQLLELSALSKSLARGQMKDDSGISMNGNESIDQASVTDAVTLAPSTDSESIEDLKIHLKILSENDVSCVYNKGVQRVSCTPTLSTVDEESGHASSKSQKSLKQTLETIDEIDSTGDMPLTAKEILSTIYSDDSQSFSQDEIIKPSQLSLKTEQNTGRSRKVEKSKPVPEKRPTRRSSRRKAKQSYDENQDSDDIDCVDESQDIPRVDKSHEATKSSKNTTRGRRGKTEKNNPRPESSDDEDIPRIDESHEATKSSKNTTRGRRGKTEKNNPRPESSDDEDLPCNKQDSYKVQGRRNSKNYRSLEREKKVKDTLSKEKRETKHSKTCDFEEKVEKQISPDFEFEEIQQQPPPAVGRTETTSPDFEFDEIEADSAGGEKPGNKSVDISAHNVDKCAENVKKKSTGSKPFKRSGKNGKLHAEDNLRPEYRSKSEGACPSRAPLPLSVFPKSLQKCKSKVMKATPEKRRTRKSTKQKNIPGADNEYLFSGSDNESIPESQDPCLMTRNEPEKKTYEGKKSKKDQSEKPKGPKFFKTRAKQKTKGNDDGEENELSQDLFGSGEPPVVEKVFGKKKTTKERKKPATEPKKYIDYDQFDDLFIDYTPNNFDERMKNNSRLYSSAEKEQESHYLSRQDKPPIKTYSSCKRKRTTTQNAPEDKTKNVEKSPEVRSKLATLKKNSNVESNFESSIAKDFGFEDENTVCEANTKKPSKRNQPEKATKKAEKPCNTKKRSAVAKTQKSVHIEDFDDRNSPDEILQPSAKFLLSDEDLGNEGDVSSNNGDLAPDRLLDSSRLFEGIVSRPNKNQEPIRPKRNRKKVNYKEATESEIDETQSTSKHVPEQRKISKEKNQVTRKKHRSSIFSDTPDEGDSKSEVSWISSTARRKKPPAQKSYTHKRKDEQSENVRPETIDDVLMVPVHTLEDTEGPDLEKPKEKVEKPRKKRSYSELNTDDDETQQDSLYFQAKKRKREKNSAKLYEPNDVSDIQKDLSAILLESLCSARVLLSPLRRTPSPKRKKPKKMEKLKHKSLPKADSFGTVFEPIQGFVEDEIEHFRYEQKQVDESLDISPILPIVTERLSPFASIQDNLENDYESEKNDEEIDPLSQQTAFTHISSLKTPKTPFMQKEKDVDELLDQEISVEDLLPAAITGTKSGPSKRPVLNKSKSSSLQQREQSASDSGSETSDEDEQQCSQSSTRSLKPRRLFDEQAMTSEDEDRKSDDDYDDNCEAQDEDFTDSREQMFEESAGDQSIMSMLSKVCNIKKQNMSATQSLLQKVTNQTVKSTQKQIGDYWESQQKRREKIVKNYRATLTSELQRLESEVKKVEVAEENMMTFFSKQLDTLRRSTTEVEDGLHRVKKLHSGFDTQLKGADEPQTAFKGKIKKTIQDEMRRLQEKILAKTQQQELQKVKRSLHAMFF